MNKYKVTGTATLTVTVEVFADDEEDALDKAHEELGGLQVFTTGGGAVYGSDNPDHEIEVYNDISYDEAELLEGECEYCYEPASECTCQENDEGDVFCDECGEYLGECICSELQADKEINNDLDDIMTCSECGKTMNRCDCL